MQSGPNPTAIIIVAFNEPEYIRKQVECIVRFCRDNTDIIIFDNGNVRSCDIRNGEEHRYLKHNLIYHKFEIDGSYKGDYNNPSISHAIACNSAFRTFAVNYKQVLFLDHDIFPIREFSVKQMLGNGMYLSKGLAQQKTKTYYWAGCLALDIYRINTDIVDFSVDEEYGLDTGGMLSRIISEYGYRCAFMDEIRIDNPNYNRESIYGQYTELNDGMFMHFINGSNWAREEGNHERVQSLFGILNQKTSI